MIFILTFVIQKDTESTIIIFGKGVYKNKMIRDLLILGIVGIGIKLLLIPAYFSTDFDVHHNWLRITYTKPITEWYYDDQSKWTLDYPPFFAYFEYILALFANFFDPNILKLVVTNNVVYFQRISVILTEIPFLYVLYIIFNKKVCMQLVLSYFFIPFIILDNIHFQYNTMLQTIFLTSLYFLIRRQNYLIAALTYSILLNFKHIYLYCSIAYFAIILKNYVLKESMHKEGQNQNKQKLVRFMKVAVVTILPFVLSFGPFIATGGLKGLGQIFSRLFPFGRGLIHDYWAPNFWALYYFSDKILAFVLKFVFRYEPFSITPGDRPLNYLKILPEPSANLTLLIILVSLIPLILHIIKQKRLDILKIIMVNGLVFFMFGYHVHQKAITPYLHLFYVFVCSSQSHQYKVQKGYQKLSMQQENQQQSKSKSKKTTHQGVLKQLYENEQKMNKLQGYCLVFFNILNLFPLLMDIKEKPLKLVITLVYWVFVNNEFKKLKIDKQPVQNIFYNNLLQLCMILIIICEVVIPLTNWINGNKFQFLPLMVNSVICAFVNLVWTLKMYISLVKSDD